MVEIKRKHLEPLIIEDAETVKEAVEYAVNHGISLEGADLTGANLSGADLTGAKLTGADLSGAKLSGANLFWANLSCADLSDTDLRGADLTGAKLSGADLSGANLSGAKLTGALLDFSCLPLWCGSLNMKIDKKIFCQLLYHALRAGQSVDDEKVKNLFSIPEIVKLANQFHRAEVCGKILQEKKTE
jgi:uncharacterized protein YjbI with pentapeptide repeats